MVKGFLALVVIVCSFTSCAKSQNLDDYLLLLENENKAMGSVSILKDGNEFYTKSIGFANVDLNKKNNSETKYRIGSISKTYTAAIILQLVDEGKLVLTDTLKKYFSEIPNSENITISDMLYHRSGIYNITTDKDFEVWISEPRGRTEMLSKIIEYKSLFKPDSKTVYSNTNYILLAYIAEDIDKQPFREIIEKRIVKKLNLTRTDFGKNIDFSKNEAMCYYPKNNQWHPITFHTNLTGTMGAGGVISNAKEVSLFYNGLFTGKLLSEKSLDLMINSKEEMGMGISVNDFNGLTVYGHDGAIDGFRSMAAYFPKLKLTICFTFNASSGASTKKIIQLFKSYQYTISQKK